MHGERTVAAERMEAHSCQLRDASRLEVMPEAPCSRDQGATGALAGAPTGDFVTVAGERLEVLARRESPALGRASCSFVSSFPCSIRPAGRRWLWRTHQACCYEEAGRPIRLHPLPAAGRTGGLAGIGFLISVQYWTARRRWAIKDS
jgi:hypothetical protein